MPTSLKKSLSLLVSCGVIACSHSSQYVPKNSPRSRLLFVENQWAAHKDGVTTLIPGLQLKQAVLDTHLYLTEKAVHKSVGAVSTYTVQQRLSEPGLLVWVNGDNGPAIWKDEQTGDFRGVAAPRQWQGLSEAVGCVKRARDEADLATATATPGVVVAWTGAGIALGGVGAWLGMWAYDSDDDALFTAGVVTALVAGGVGLVLALVGRSRVMLGQAHAVDAVNIYNDDYSETPACAGTLTNTGR